MTIDWESVREQFERQADWRREKAEEYPHDAERNLEAAAVLDGLAATVKDISEGVRALYERIFTADPLICGEIENELMSSIHIGSSTADEFFAEVCELAREKVREDLDSVEN